ncbi:MAG: hypothetical protein JO291_14800 [Acidimicrobiia bacterium]|nr:hypothetical protein [Acidimicrobiia bacterium]
MDDNATPQPPQPPAPPPNPFVVPPPAPPVVPPAPRARMLKQLRAVAIVVVVIVIGLAVAGHIGRGSVSTKDLDAGMCIRNPQGTFKSAHRQDCAKPHDAEILGWIDDVNTLPVLQGTPSDAAKACVDRFAQYTGTPLDTSTYHVGYFDKKGTIGQADVLCFVRSADGLQLTGSLAASTTS